MNMSRSFYTSDDTKYLPGRSNHCNRSYRSAGSLEKVRAGQKFRTTPKLSDYSSYLWIEKKISKLDQAEIFRYESLFLMHRPDESDKKTS